jgi:hypothetical protein
MLIRILYRNGKFDMVKPAILKELITSDKLKSFFRSEGWATVGVDPTRGMGGTYEGRERRKTLNMQL